MTRKEAVRSADALHELAIAAVIGAGGDLVIVGSRAVVDLAGMALGGLFFAWSLALTRRLGGPSI